ncbi:transmembrane reductase CYB561D2-like isoform X2 [Plodia interpunctella]|nr:transmembrane reductase CYB561D2-like isoform X2 [Plodia interpunctella]
MESLDQDISDNNMSQPDRNSESSRLVTANASSKPSYLNIFSNLLSLVFVGIVTYCSFVNGITLFSFHPPLMAIGWMIIMTSAINAISPGDLATEWMPIRLRSARHWVLQLFGAILILAGFLVILSNKIINNKPHFATLHAKFGLSALIFMAATMLGGIGALYSLKLKHYLAPIYTKLLHASIGLVTFSLGVVAISCGLFSDWFSAKGEILQYTSLVIVILVMLFTLLRPSLKVYFRLRERLDNVN